jgi:tetratricopeptide (TPR) repeat protein
MTTMPAGEKSLDEVAQEVAAAAAAGRIEAATSLAAASWRRWLVAGDSEGGRRLLAPVLEREGPPSRERVIALYADGIFLFRLGENAASHARNEAALQVARTVGDAEAESLALVGLSRVAFREGRHEDVVRLAGDARALAAAADSDALAAPLHMEAAGNRLLGHHDRAVELYRESRALAERRGDARGVAMEQHNLGHVELRRGNVDAAAELFAARLEYAATSTDPYERAMTALNESALAAARGEDDRARASLEEASRVLADHSIVLDPDDAFELDALAARYR